MNDRAEQPGPVTTRALRLLETFTPDRTELTLSEMARRAGLPVSTAHRLAADLAAAGALERNERTGKFHIGLHLWEIASLAPRGTVLREVALPVMEELARITHENVQLGVRDGLELVFVERIRSKESVPLLTRVGGRFTLPATGLGLALLAHECSRIQELVLSGPLERFTEHTITDADHLRRVLSEVRRSGIAVSDRQVSIDTLSVAAPIFDENRKVRAAVSVVVDADTARPVALTPLLQAAAASIGRALCVQNQASATPTPAAVPPLNTEAEGV